MFAHFTEILRSVKNIEERADSYHIENCTINLASSVETIIHSS